jgi:hypothetical protein
MNTRWIMAFPVLLISITNAFAEDFALHTFDRQRLTDTYYSEGANAGDIDGDGDIDVVYGPHWYEGPKFEAAHEIYPPKPQPVEGYADNFFNWVYDFNGDGAADVFVVGFPGTPAYVYENPKSGGITGHWKKHKVFESVSNESPQFIDIVGDSKPELICTTGGAFGFAVIDWSHPFEAWKFHKISDQSAPERFGHGLGVGDVNGDDKQDILMATGWFEQPTEKPTETTWKFHPVSFTDSYGGAEMYAYDVDGDGDNDIITSLAAHDFGLAWYEQDRSGPESTFRKHLIMGSKASQNRYGVVFSEPHSLALVDMDGDGLKDIVTGKTYYSHHKKSPMWDAGAVVYWFRLTRSEKGVDWVPYKADGESGIGRQVSIVDVNRDGLPDIVVGGMKGSHVLIHRKTKVSQPDFEKAQPKPTTDYAPETARGRAADIDTAIGKVAGAIEAETLKVSKATSGKTFVQDMKSFVKGKWSGGQQLFWTGASPGDRLDLEFETPEAGSFEVLGVFTMAPDYAIIRCEIDGQNSAGPIDLYEYPGVVSTGEMKLGKSAPRTGTHKLSIIVEGSNPAAVKSHMVGLDYIRLQLTQ